MKIGIISRHNFELIQPPASEWKIYNFSISTNKLSPSEILDSAFAPPSRYLQEIFDRLTALDDQEKASDKFIFNPLFETNRPSLIISISKLEKAKKFSGITILVDTNDIPIGYLLPPLLTERDSKYLTLLSCISGALDAEMLELLFYTNTRRLVARTINLKKFDNCGFSYKNLGSIYRWTAQKSRDAILNAYSTKDPRNTRIEELQKCRDEIRFTAIMPFHAGDVLFFSIAFNCTGTHISRLAVNSAYKNIVYEIAPQLECLTLNTPPPNREQRENISRPTPDHVFLTQVKDLFPSNSFYFFCRQSRNYNLPDFHLIDQFAFALGRPTYSNSDLLFNSKPLPGLFQKKTNTKRILIHFDGGWPLKIYPTGLQERLTRLLSKKGYLVTVLSDTPSPNLECAVVPFSNLENFKELLKSNDLLVGMDSFPCHYAAHILGLPTICLFASTKPSNSNAPATASYCHLEQGLKCRPCYATNTCPIHWDNFCRNFTPPEIVVDKVEEMLSRCYKLPVAACHRDAQSTGANHRSPGSHISKKRLILINTSHLELRASIAGLIIPFYCYSSTLLREFAASVQREGIVGALRRTARYLIRLIK